MNSINPNMAQLMQQQQIINTKTHQLQLELQQTHLEFTNSRINSTVSTHLNHSGSANKQISQANDHHQTASEFVKRDNSSARSFKSNSMIASSAQQQPVAAVNSNNVYQFQNTRSRYDPFPSLGNSRPIIPVTAPPSSINLKQYRRDNMGGMAGILNHGNHPSSNANTINLNQFGMKDAEVYNPYSTFNKTNTIYGAPNLMLDKYKKTKLW
jgi:hypothetical protein